MLRSQNKNEITFKKQAFRSKLRKQWLDQYFKDLRNSISNLELQKQGQEQHILSIINQLPQKIIELVAEVNQNFQLVATVLFENIEVISEKMVRLEVVEWSHYVYVINRLLNGPASREQIQKIIVYTLVPVLQCGELLASNFSNDRYYYNLILMDCLQYSFRLGRYVKMLDQIQQNALVSVLLRLWKHNLTQQQQLKLLCICNNILSISFDSEQLQNISPHMQNDLQLMKITFINMLFYKDEQVMQRLIIKCYFYCVKEQKQRQNYDIVNMHLRVLINITKFLDKPAYYYPLLNCNILSIINKNIVDSHPQTLIYSIRLLNNLLVNDTDLTQKILKEIFVAKLKSNFIEHKQQGVQVEIIELFINLVHFMNADEDIIRGLVNLDIQTIMIQYLENYHTLEENLITQILSVLLIMINHHPIDLKVAISKNYRLIKSIAQECMYASNLADQLINVIQSKQDFGAL